MTITHDDIEAAIDAAFLSVLGGNRRADETQRKPPSRAEIRRAYRDCAVEGLTMAETAAKLGVAYGTVASFARNHGIAFAKGYRQRAAIMEASA